MSLLHKSFTPPQDKSGDTTSIFLKFTHHVDILINNCQMLEIILVVFQDDRNLMCILLGYKIVSYQP